MSTDNGLGAILDADEPSPMEPMAPTGQQEPQDMGVKQEAAEPPTAAKQEPEPDHVPRAALMDERKKRQEYEKRLAEIEQRLQQPKQEQAKPDWFADPDNAAAAMREQLEHAMFEQRITLSEEVISEKYPDYADKRDAFAAAAKENPYLAQQLVKAANPAKFAYEMGKRILLANEIGNDPDSYRAKLEADFRKKYGIPDDGQPAAPHTPQRNSAPVPRSLASTPSAPRATNGRFVQNNGPTPLEDILG